MRRQPTAYHSMNPFEPMESATYHSWNPFEPVEPQTKTPKMSEEQLRTRQKKMEALDVVKDSVTPLSQRIEEATDCIEGKEYLYLQDQLERCHIALDNIEADGDDEVRKKRKSIAVLVSEVLNRLDVKANKASDEDQSNEIEVIDDDNDNFCKNMQSNDGIDPNDPEDDSNGDKCEYTLTNKDDVSIIKEAEQIPESEGLRSNEFVDESCEELLDNRRIRMQLFDNCINLVVDVRYIQNDDLKIRFEEEGLLVTGRRGDKKVRMSKIVPSDCIVDRAVFQLSSDGFMLVKVPRRRQLHPFQMRRHPFWF